MLQYIEADICFPCNTWPNATLIFIVILNHLGLKARVSAYEVKLQCSVLWNLTFSFPFKEFFIKCSITKIQFLYFLEVSKDGRKELPEMEGLLSRQEPAEAWIQIELESWERPYPDEGLYLLQVSPGFSDQQLNQRSGISLKALLVSLNLIHIYFIF
jgi:hypothetical protein